MSPIARPKPNETPANSKYTAAESVASVIRNRTRNKRGAGIVETRMANQGATFKTRARAASFFESLPVESFII